MGVAQGRDCLARTCGFLWPQPSSSLSHLALMYAYCVLGTGLCAGTQRAGARLSSPGRVTDTGPLPSTQQALTKDWLNGCVNVTRHLPKHVSKNVQILGG